MSLAPGFILATPKLEGGYFDGTVILMLSHDNEGAFGLVVNRIPDSIQSKSILQLLQIDEPLIMPGVLAGGPVQPERAFLLHGGETWGEETMEACSGLLVSSRQETLALLCKEAKEPFWIVLGYAGWQGGQLEQEIEDGAWLAAPMADRADWVLGESRESLWTDLAVSLGLVDWESQALFSTSTGLQ